MKFILKVLFAPIIAVLAGFIWLCALALRMSAWALGIVSTILGILGLAVVSFKDAEGFEIMYFSSHEEKMAFAIDKCSSGYRIQ